MQTANVNVPITVTGRHVNITPAIRDYAEKKISNLQLDYPRIIEAKAILDVEKTRHICEIVLFCANRITIDASSQTDDMYASIDETISKIARRMRKFKTRLLKSHRPRREEVKVLSEYVYADAEEDFIDEAIAKSEQPEEGLVDTHDDPPYLEKVDYTIRTLFRDEALMEMEMTERHMILFYNAKDGELNIVYRRKNGGVGVIENL